MSLVLSFEVQDTVRRLRPGAESFYPAGVTHFNLLNPQVVESWQSLLLDTATLPVCPTPLDRLWIEKL